MAATASAMSTPLNTLSRDNLAVLIRNNILNESLELMSDCDCMDMDSPIRKPALQPISKKLFHSPMTEHSPKDIPRSEANRSRRAKKRKQILIPDSGEKIKRAFVKECEGDSPDGGMRKRVLISLFHNKEYSMDFS